MAKIKEMTFSKQLKLSHGYNSYGVGFGVTMEMEDGDDSKDIKAKGWKTVDQQIESQLTDAIKLLQQLSD